MSKKRPSKEHFQLKQRWELEDSVFDRRVLLIISKFMKKGLIKSVDFPISRGKEANVYKATAPDDTLRALKIYRMETTQFFKKQEYILGDPRFSRVKKDLRNLAFAFTQKEYKNLMLCERIGVSSPRPVEVRENLILMTYLGIGTEVFPQLIRLDPDQKLLKQILEQIKLMYKNDFVHSDLSPYNIMVEDGKKIYIIDLAQGVVKGHPSFERFLERDVLNVLAYFKKKDDLEKTLKWIRK